MSETHPAERHQQIPRTGPPPAPATECSAGHAGPGVHLEQPRRLGRRQVHVWLIDLEVGEGALEELRKTLDSEEAARAARFHFPHHRARFEAAHGALRELLGAYLELPPAEVRLVRDPAGKPRLAGAAASLQFNLSHSHDKAIAGFCRPCALGVDLEQMRQSLELNEIAGRYFAREEQAELIALPEEQRVHGFFNCWTRKEAYLKGCGVGIVRGLDNFAVSLAPGASPRLLFDRLDPGAPASWAFYDLDAWPGYKASLAVNGMDLTIEQFEFRVENFTGSP